MGVRIIIADDHQIVREGLRSILQHDLNIDVVGLAENGRTTIELAKELKPDIVIMDISMPDLNGMEATRRILEENPAIKVIALSMHSDQQFVSEMLKAGASAYLLKDCALDELERAIRSVMGRQIYISPTVAGSVVKDYVHHLSKEKSSVLTSREREVLQLIAEGKSAKQIAYQLKVSVKTIEGHRMHIMEKLDIYSVAELTKYAIRAGVTFLER
ncbi:MAG: response regulator transcription factor [Ignavibacteria bacterium]|nr:MAG: response regulator transcription factor [Ignavibacteria bacterium]